MKSHSIQCSGPKGNQLMVLHLECDLFLVRNLLDRPVVFVKLQYCPVQQVVIARTRRCLGKATIPLVALSNASKISQRQYARSVVKETTVSSTATKSPAHHPDVLYGSATRRLHLEDGAGLGFRNCSHINGGVRRNNETFFQYSVWVLAPPD